METCITRNLQYKRSIKHNHVLTNTHSAVSNQYYCRQCKQKINLADKNTHLQSDKHKNIRKVWYCEICEEKIINTKSKHINSNINIHRKEYGIVVEKYKILNQKLMER